MVCGRRLCKRFAIRVSSHFKYIGKVGGGVVCHEESLSWGFERGEIVAHKNSHNVFVFWDGDHMIVGDWGRHLCYTACEFRDAVMAIAVMIAKHPSACPPAVQCS